MSISRKRILLSSNLFVEHIAQNVMDIPRDMWIGGCLRPERSWWLLEKAACGLGCEGLGVRVVGGSRTGEEVNCLCFVSLPLFFFCVWGRIGRVVQLCKALTDHSSR